MNPCATWRSGGYRATYHPEWDKARPWILYINGTAIALHAATERGAMFALEQRGADPKKWEFTA